VEAALIAPALVVILLGIADWGLAIEQHERMQTAVRAGAQTALFDPTDQTRIRTAICTAAGTPSPAAVAAATTGCPATCSPGNTAPAAVTTCSCDGGATRQTCPADCGGASAATFVSLRVSQPNLRISPIGPLCVDAEIKVRIN
jgi:Flp pilus assembly protein TadG